ncbi:MAG: hypothetical protein B5M54_06970 [Candidatus Aminicenantes bacterium 4484_214]|nr:MAG: hypothetical protein B5M54_06970 [Candidatus Aminicenantes bacterium 4484_214]
MNGGWPSPFTFDSQEGHLEKEVFTASLKLAPFLFFYLSLLLFVFPFSYCQRLSPGKNFLN